MVDVTALFLQIVTSVDYVNGFFESVYGNLLCIKPTIIRNADDDYYYNTICDMPGA